MWETKFPRNSHAGLGKPLLTLPNEDVGRATQPFRTRFRSTFQGCEYWIRATTRWKSASKTRSERLGRPSNIFVWGAWLYDANTLVSMLACADLTSPNPAWLFLGECMLPKRRFWKAGQTFQRENTIWAKNRWKSKVHQVWVSVASVFTEWVKWRSSKWGHRSLMRRFRHNPPYRRFPKEEPSDWKEMSGERASALDWLWLDVGITSISERFWCSLPLRNSYPP